MLSDERIEDIADANGHASVISYGRPAKREVIWYDGDLTPFARAIESAATAPLLAEIERLTRELEEARKDAERYRWLTENKHVPWGAMKLPINTLLDDGIDAAIDRAIKEQT